MSFKPQTDDKESLQALAFALRQQKGSDITYNELQNAMKGLGSLDPNVRQFCGIDYSKLEERFNNWVTVGTEKDKSEWINSSVWVANAVIPSAYIKGGGYIFYQSGLLPDFRGAFKEIAKNIALNAKSSVVKRVYAIMSKGTGDKWNPADVLALKVTKDTKIQDQMTAFKNGNPNLRQFKDAMTLKERNKKLMKSAKTRKEQQNLSIVEDMGILYWYNQFIDNNYKSGECVPISLKKVLATKKEILAEVTPAVRIKSFDHKEDKGIQEAVNLDLKITSVEYRPTTQKCIVNFTLGGETGHFMDIRGTESSKKIADVQMQLQKGAAANHGKATLPVFALITKLSKGRQAISAQLAEKRKIFKKTKIPIGKDHMFTDWKIFDDYARKTERGATFSQTSLKRDIQKWAKYIQFLTKGKNKSMEIVREFDKKNVGAKGTFDAAKYLKNKVQSYEVGMILDENQTQIKKMVKENIMKSVYSQAASKGFRIFGDNQITDYMTASSYLKVGG